MRWRAACRTSCRACLSAWSTPRTRSRCGVMAQHGHVQLLHNTTQLVSDPGASRNTASHVVPLLAVLQAAGHDAEFGHVYYCKAYEYE